jgi:uncharacterized protein (TIGR02996 family)
MARIGYLKLLGSKATDVVRETPLRGTSVLGRSPQCEVVVPDGAVTRQHAKIIKEGAQWSLYDMGGTNGTWLNGERIERAAPLKHGDRVRVGQTEYEFTELDEQENRLTELEAAIAANPEDDGPWQVYADFLLEHADALGERIRGIDTNHDRWLEATAGLVRARVISVSWEHGHVATALLNSAAFHTRVAGATAAATLLGLRICHFIRELHINLAYPLHEDAAQLTRVLEHLAGELSGSPLPALRRITFDPLHDPTLTGVQMPMLPNAPRLAPPVVSTLKRCWLEENGVRTELVPGAPHPLAGVARLERRFRWRLTPNTSEVSITSRGQRFQLLGGAAMVSTHLLQPGDRIHLGTREVLFGGE